MRSLRTLAFGLGAAAAFAAPAWATDLTVTCRCVVGGVNSATATWIEESVIPGFQAKAKAEGKDVSVTLKQFGGQDEQLTQQLALDFSSGAGADVSGFDGFLIPSFVEGDLLKPLTAVGGSAVKTWDGWNHISAGSRQLMSYKGSDYGIASGTDVRAIFTRRDLLDKAGLDGANWQPKSWAELLDAARALKKAGIEFPLQLDAGVNMGEATTMQGYYMAVLGTGHGVVDTDGKYIVSSPGILDALNLYKTIYIDEKLGDQRAQLLGDGRNRTFANFRDGKTALLVEGDWFYNSVMAPGSEFGMDNRDQMVGWAKMPAEKPGMGLRGQDFVTVSGGTGFVINPNTKNPELSWELLAYMNSKEQLDAYETYRPIRSIRDDVTTPENTYIQDTSKSLLPLTTARPNDPNYSKVSVEIQRMTEAVVSGAMSPEDAMAQYKAAVTKIVGADNTVELK
ncbi:MAG TPA: extracellular solute-binding protein [Devosiaceae bacterium]